MVQPFDIFDLLSDTEEGRRISFQTRLGQSALSNNTNNAQLSNLFQPFQNQFFANQGQRIQEQQAPQSFTDFLNNDFNFDREVRRAPSQQTGRSPSRFSGPSRFLFSQ